MDFAPRQRGSLDDALDLGFVDEGDDGRHVHTHRHAGLGEPLHGLQAALR